jgi:hypothetical protein
MVSVALKKNILLSIVNTFVKTVHMTGFTSENIERVQSQIECILQRTGGFYTMEKVRKNRKGGTSWLV